MEKIKLAKHDAKIIQIVLNETGEYSAISANDSTLFDRYVLFCRWLIEQSEKLPQTIKEIEKKYEGQEETDALVNQTVEMSKANVDFSKEAIQMADSIFGTDTIKKYFRSIYDEIPDFLPDADCFFDFLYEITPQMEKIFNRKIEDRNRRSKEKMAKYQPQDHKRKAK